MTTHRRGQYWRSGGQWRDRPAYCGWWLFYGRPKYNDLAYNNNRGLLLAGYNYWPDTIPTVYITISIRLQHNGNYLLSQQYFNVWLSIMIYNGQLAIYYYIYRMYITSPTDVLYVAMTLCNDVAYSWPWWPLAIHVFVATVATMWLAVALQPVLPVATSHDCVQLTVPSAAIPGQLAAWPGWRGPPAQLQRITLCVAWPLLTG